MKYFDVNNYEQFIEGKKYYLLPADVLKKTCLY
jgi:hypothetical protein